MNDTTKTELAAFLRAQRRKLQPTDIGLTVSGVRRTPGLRREEVADLAGVSLTWYTWLEQGRDIATSTQVVDALARALRLDPDHHRHLRRLAGLPAPEPTTTHPVPDERLQRLVDAAAAAPTVLYDRHYDYLAWNTAYTAVRHHPDDLPADHRNMLWWMFTDPTNRARMQRWEPAARAVLSQFRSAAGKHPDDARFADLVDALTTTSPEFRHWWPDYSVREFKPATIVINHPTTGPIALELHQLRPVDHPDLLLVEQIPLTPTDANRVQTLVQHTQPNSPPAPP